MVSNAPAISFLTNKEASAKLEKNKEVYSKQLNDIYDSLSAPQVFFTLFRSLWYTTLPCFDVMGMTFSGSQRTSFLKQCKWRGSELSCSSIFSTFPTDQGMCCTFNMANANDIFVESAFSNIIMEMQKRDAKEALENATLPEGLSMSELKAHEGSHLSLEVVLDAHTDLLSPFSIESDFAGFSALILAKNNFPLVQQKGFSIEPGKKNSISLDAIKINADADIRSIEPKKRRCLFKDESSGLTLFKNYSQANCFLECSLTHAQKKVAKSSADQFNGKYPSKCTPW